jgi:hypothetical protein
MPRSHTAILLLAGALAACHDTTAPLPRLAPDATKPEADMAQLGAGYTATSLPLTPAGINDSGVIVGTVGSKAARYYNGALTPLLPLLYQPSGNYEGQAINRRGAMAGNIEYGPGLFWTSPSQVPRLISPPSAIDDAQPLVPTAMNNSDVVVGVFLHRPRDGSVTEQRAFRWSPRLASTEDITPVGYTQVTVMDVNDAGYVVGYGSKPGGLVQALRWAPWAGNQAEELSGIGTTGTAVASDGTALGNADGFTTTRRWPVGGLAVALEGPQNSSPDDISITGRIVGFTYRFSPLKPHQPWTHRNGVTTFLPVPNAANTDNVLNLRVNSCGSIIGQQVFTTGNWVGGVLWTRIQCDLQAPTPW